MFNNKKLKYLFETDYYYSFLHYLNKVIKYYNKYVLPNKSFIYKPRTFIKYTTIYYNRDIKYILQSILIYLSLKIKSSPIKIQIRLKRIYHYYYYIFIKKYSKIDIIEFNTFEDVLKACLH